MKMHLMELGCAVSDFPYMELDLFALNVHENDPQPPVALPVLLILFVPTAPLLLILHCFNPA